MRQKPTEGYDDRIAMAQQQGPRPMSVRALAEELGERYSHLRGTSYGGVRQYAEGKVRNPRFELLRAIADVLGVRSEWLAFGSGAMTAKDQERAETLDAGQPDDTARYFETLASSSPTYRHAGLHLDVQQSWRVLGLRLGVPQVPDDDDRATVTYALDVLLTSLLRAFSPGANATASAAYLRATLQAAHEAMDGEEARWAAETGTKEKDQKGALMQRLVRLSAHIKEWEDTHE